MAKAKTTKAAVKKTKKTVKHVKKSPPKKVASRKPAAQKPLTKKSVPRKATQEKLSKGGLPEQMLTAALKILDDRKADDVAHYNLAGRSSMADYLVIASGQASRQIAAIAHYLNDAFHKLGARNVRIEGISEGNWVIVDSGDVIVHLFRPEVRAYYKLEDIWNRKVTQ